eukprot:536161-Prymnesium_polylepis.1
MPCDISSSARASNPPRRAGRPGIACEAAAARGTYPWRRPDCPPAAGPRAASTAGLASFCAADPPSSTPLPSLEPPRAVPERLRTGKALGWPWPPALRVEQQEPPEPPRWTAHGPSWTPSPSAQR